MFRVKLNNALFIVNLFFNSKENLCIRYMFPINDNRNNIIKRYISILFNTLNTYFSYFLSSFENKYIMNI